jgi:shikimate kinase
MAFLFLEERMNIVLIGFRAVGKTSLGRLLAQELGLGFLDTDMLVQEHIGEDIRDFVTKHGWQAFRGIEAMILKSLAGLDNYVIATGGGVVELLENLNLLKSLGPVVWIKAPIPKIKERLSDHTRPSLTGQGPKKEVESVLKKRTPLYLRAADLVFDTQNLDLKEACRTLKLCIQELMGGRCAR